MKVQTTKKTQTREPQNVFEALAMEDFGRKNGLRHIKRCRQEEASSNERIRQGIAKRVRG